MGPSQMRSLSMPVPRRAKMPGKRAEGGYGERDLYSPGRSAVRIRTREKVAIEVVRPDGCSSECGR